MSVSEFDTISFVNRLGRGRKNAKHTDELCRETGFSKRKLRGCREYALRHLGEPIAATNDGIYIAETESEYRETLHIMDSTAKSILYSAKVFREKLGEVSGQLELEI